MRITILNRLEPKYVVPYVIGVLGFQLAEGTNLLFAVLIAVFTLLWAHAFNVAGGLERPAGSFIFSNGLTSVVIGFGAKVILNEPAERNLKSPINLMLTYTAGMAMMLLVAILVRALRPQRPLLSGFKSLDQMRQASIVCLFAGIAISALASVSQAESGSLISALAQINGFPVVAIFLATTYQIRHTDGRRSVNWVVVTAIGLFAAASIFYFGKSGIMLGFLAWGFAAALNGYSFKLGQIAGLALGAAFFVYYFVPYSQYVRVYASKTGSVSENIPIALEYLSDLPRTRELYEAAISEIDLKDDLHLYDQREGFLDRLIQIPADDLLINYTDQGNIFGLAPVYLSYVNVIPHFLWPGKPRFNFGNDYAHELGMVSEEDFTTGVAFSPEAESYHLAGWLGVLVLMPVQLFLLFIVYESVTGGTKDSVFAMIPILNFFVGGAEGGITSVGHVITLDLLGVLFIAWTTKVAMPFVLNVIRDRSIVPIDVAPAQRPLLPHLVLQPPLPSSQSGNSNV